MRGLKVSIIPAGRSTSAAKVSMRSQAAQSWILTICALCATMVCLCSLSSSLRAVEPGGTGVLLPDGNEFVSWERPLEFTKTYYVDNRNPHAADSNPGTKQLPFLTISKAAKVLEHGERVVIMAGVYRERVSPARGGTGADRMISYEATPGAEVIVKGSVEVNKGWGPSTEYGLDLSDAARANVKIYKRRLDDIEFHGYNPFGMVNMMQDRRYLNPTPAELRRHLLRRGMIYVDGKRLEQVEEYAELGQSRGRAFLVRARWHDHPHASLRRCRPRPTPGGIDRAGAGVRPPAGWLELHPRQRHHL